MFDIHFLDSLDSLFSKLSHNFNRDYWEFRKKSLKGEDPPTVSFPKFVSFNLFLMEQIEFLKALGERKGLEFVVLKGPLFSQQLYRDLLRPSTDLDLYVGEGFEGWAKVLKEEGFTSNPRYADVFVKKPLVIDLHRTFINATRVPSRISFHHQLLALFRTETSESGISVPTLEFYLNYIPAHNLLHHSLCSIPDHIDLLFLYDKIHSSPLLDPTLINLKFLDILPGNSIKEKIFFSLVKSFPTVKHRYWFTYFLFENREQKLNYLKDLLKLVKYSFLL